MYKISDFSKITSLSVKAPIQCYHDAEYMEEGADLELCLPTKKMISHPDVTAKKLPAIKAICTTHVGSYEKLNLAYKALVDYANEHHLNCITPSRETYVKGPGMIFRGNEDNYITEIIIPGTKPSVIEVPAMNFLHDPAAGICYT